MTSNSWIFIITLPSPVTQTVRLPPEAFGIRTLRIDSEAELEERVREALEYDGPVVCRVKADIEQKIVPRQANYMKEDGQMASRPLDDMTPLLSRDELTETRWK